MKSSCLSDHSSSDESLSATNDGEPVTSPPVSSSPSTSSLKAVCSGSNSRQGSPRGSTLHIPAAKASLTRPQLRSIRTRKRSSGGSTSSNGGGGGSGKSSALKKTTDEMMMAAVLSKKDSI